MEKAMSQRDQAGSTLLFNSRTNAMFYNGMMSQRAAPSVSMFHSVWSSPAQFDAEKSSSHDSNASSVDSMWSFGSIWSPKHTPTSTESAPFADSSDKDWSDILKILSIDKDENVAATDENETSLDFANNGRDLDLHEKELTLTTTPFAFSTPIPVGRKIRGTGNVRVPKKENHRRLDYTAHSYEKSNKTATSGYKKMKIYKKSTGMFCAFCKNNGFPESVYKSHVVKDDKGRAICPRLRAYKCPNCNLDGDLAHTMKYCPNRAIITEDKAARDVAISTV